MQWIGEHCEIITASATREHCGLVIYLQIFVSSCRRQLRATLLITRGVGDELAARCLSSHMSRGLVHVASAPVTLHMASGTMVGRG